jgi:hypoxanthine phosphoribosyltransferase
MRESIPSDSDMPSNLEEVTNLYTQMITRGGIQSFLQKILGDVKPDVVISTLRKGYWIMEDFMRAYEIDATHMITDDVKPEDLRGKSVLIFDDSIHTGKGIKDAVKKVEMLTQSPVHVACIAINREAYDSIKSMEHVDVTYLKMFDEYAKFERNEFSPGCQAYYYLYYMVPHISTLSVKDSPDFCSLRLRFKKSSTDAMSKMVDCVLESLKDLILPDEVHRIDSYFGTERRSAGLDWEKASGRVEAFEKDIAKIRISVAAYPNYSELVLTPMICPKFPEDSVNDNIDIEHLLFITSEDFINTNVSVVLKGLEISGFQVISCELIHTAPRREC